MKGLRRCILVLKRTGAVHILWSFVIFMMIASCIITWVEPEIENIGDGIWYCFVASTTVGFGDIYAVTTIGRILTALVTIYGIMVVAMIPGVVLAYYLEYVKAVEKQTISMFLNQLENLPDLSKEELEEISNRVKNMKNI